MTRADSPVGAAEPDADSPGGGLEPGAGGQRLLTRRDRVLLAVVAGLVAAFVADWRGLVPVETLLFGWRLGGLDWLFLLASAVFLAYFVVPLWANPRRTMGYWRRLRRDPFTLASLLVLVAMGLLGLVGPALFPPDRPPFGGTVGPYGIPVAQPPVGFSVPADAVGFCEGRVAGGRCHGSWTYPLGTTIGGKDVFGMTVAGARVALEAAVVTAALMGPLATLVGTVAGTVGGAVDEVLMRVVDLQLSIPAFFLVIVAEGTVEMQTGIGSLLVVVLVFGLFSWGGAARVVRSTAKQHQAAGFVRAAQVAGGSRLWVVRTHVVPNVFNVVVTAVTLQIAWLVLLEATLSFLQIGSGVRPSWGYVVTTSVSVDAFPTLLWWGVLFPTLALGATVVALQVLGDGLRDVLDPRLVD